MNDILAIFLIGILIATCSGDGIRIKVNDTAYQVRVGK